MNKPVAPKPRPEPPVDPAAAHVEAILDNATHRVHTEAVDAMTALHRYAQLMDRPTLESATQDVLDALDRVEAAL
ncbi:hypothetical protein [Demequina gelatinilytica]|uniref:hypothetical protein n=1 Tax=Demequina gelatinilytica TaxID=1638980 RepID=UPI0007831F79|nr:hypothetical protein [Demequina gelatinilytica]